MGDVDDVVAVDAVVGRGGKAANRFVEGELMMLSRNRRMKMFALLASGAMVLQFGGGGCLGGVIQQAGIGFGRALGAAPAAAVSAALGLDTLISGLLPAAGA